MDTRLDQNEAELGVAVLAVALKVLADGNSLDWLAIALCWGLGGRHTVPKDGATLKAHTFLMSM